MKMPNIRPSSELRNNYTGIMKFCRQKKQPVFLTVNGKGDSVILPIELYEQSQEEQKLALLLDEAEAEINAGNCFSHEEIFGELNQKIERLRKTENL